MKKIELECLNEKGLKISIKLFLPLIQDNKKYKTIIMSHGFMANRLMCINDAKRLAKEGYVCVTFDFCGGGLGVKSEGKTSDMSVLTEVEDLKSVFNFILSVDYVDSKNIYLLGYSQGGLVSSLVANELKDKIKGLILLYPAFSIPDDARKGHMIFAKFDPSNPRDIIHCGPMKLGKIYVNDALSLKFPEDFIKYEGNTIIIHGDADKIVDIKYSKIAIEEYKKLNNNDIFKIIHNGPHMFISSKQIKEAQKYMLEFLKNN